MCTYSDRNIFRLIFFSDPLYLNKYKNNYKIQYNGVCVY